MATALAAVEPDTDAEAGLYETVSATAVKGGAVALGLGAPRTSPKSKAWGAGEAAASPARTAMRRVDFILFDLRPHKKLLKKEGRLLRKEIVNDRWGGLMLGKTETTTYIDNFLYEAAQGSGSKAS